MWCHPGCSFSKERFWSTASLCSITQHKPHSFICHCDTCDKYKLMLTVSSEVLTWEKCSGVSSLNCRQRIQWFSSNKKQFLGKTSLLSASVWSVELSGPPGSCLRTWEKQRGLWLRSLGVHVSFSSYRKEGLNSRKINVSRRNGWFSSESSGYITRILLHSLKYNSFDSKPLSTVVNEGTAKWEFLTIWAKHLTEVADVWLRAGSQHTLWANTRGEISLQCKEQQKTGS